MSIGLSVALYIVIWWVMLFAVLPFGIESQSERDSVVGGTEPGAPTRPRLWWKMLITTGVSAVVFAIAYVAISNIEL